MTSQPPLPKPYRIVLRTLGWLFLEYGDTLASFFVCLFQQCSFNQNSEATVEVPLTVLLNLYCVFLSLCFILLQKHASVMKIIRIIQNFIISTQNIVLKGKLQRKHFQARNPHFQINFQKNECLFDFWIAIKKQSK